MNTFGRALMRSLLEHRLECLGIDISREQVQRAAAEFPSVLEADATSEEALTAAGVKEYDTAVVAVASKLAASILATMTLKALGVKTVAAKSHSEQHSEALRRVGADLIIFPEQDSAERLAQLLLFHGLADVRIVAEGFCLAKVRVLPALVGVALSRSGLRSRFGLNVVLVEHLDGKKRVPEPDYVLARQDALYVVGWEKTLAEYSRALEEPRDGS